MKSAVNIARSLLMTLEMIDSRHPSSNTQYPTSVPYLKWMCEQIIRNDGEWDLDKSHRWIGYIQGAIVARGFVSLDQERDRVRGIPDIELAMVYADDGVAWPYGKSTSESAET